MKVDLAFDETGRIATITHPNGLVVARLLVYGPFKRNAESVAQNFDDTFNGEVRGIGDNQYIDERSFSIKEVNQ